MQNYNIDSHKLIYHPHRVAKWMDGENVYPINAEICLFGGCNHRCVFCEYDYLKYHTVCLNKDLLLRNIEILKKNGLMSVLLCGSGEPLLHKDFVDICYEIKKMGLDIALSTNGVFFDSRIADMSLHLFSWIRFSVSGGEKSYRQVHRAQIGDYEKVFSNIKYASSLKQRNKYMTVLNLQMILLPENECEVYEVGAKAKDNGVDIFVVKSMSEQNKSENGLHIDESFYRSAEKIDSKLQNLSDDSFGVVFRYNRINSMYMKREYKECYASPFHVYINADGEVYPCCDLQGYKEYSFGNINNLNIDEIWEGKRRAESVRRLKENKLRDCVPGCKLDAMNCYLNELKNPSPHVNFI